jgi:hypothetical protein
VYPFAVRPGQQGWRVDSNTAASFDDAAKTLEYSMNFTHSILWKRTVATLVMVTASLLVMSATSFAQGHGLRNHQRQERYYNGHASRGHQQAEWRSYNNSDYYNNDHSNDGYYNNRHGYSSGVYNNRHGNGGAYYNGGYNTRRPHYDSGSFGNRLHHAFGGH